MRQNRRIRAWPGLLLPLIAFILFVGCVSQAAYDEVVAENNLLMQKLRESEEANQSLSEQYSTLEDLYHKLDQNLDQARLDYDALSVTRDQLVNDIATQVDEHAILDGRYKSLVALHSSMIVATGSLETLQTDLNDLNIEYTALQQQITDLQTQRQALIPETYNVIFACTGSMEPKVTCLDSAIYLANFLPEEIVVGAVVSFNSPDGCSLSSTRRVSHRVIAIADNNGPLNFRTKGDANEADDGCWVPASNIHGYMVELNKNTHPENTELRNRVNGAEAEYVAAHEAYESLREAYLAKKQEYEIYVATWCPNNQCPSQYFPTALALYDEMEALRVAHNQSSDYSNVKLDAYRAALEEARNQ
jgi:signal peptidase I